MTRSSSAPVQPTLEGMFDTHPWKVTRGNMVIGHTDEAQALDLAARLVRQGHRVTVHDDLAPDHRTELEPFDLAGLLDLVR